MRTAPTQLHIHTYTYTYIHIYIHIHIYTYDVRLCKDVGVVRRRLDLERREGEGERVKDRDAWVTTSWTRPYFVFRGSDLHSGIWRNYHVRYHFTLVREFAKQ